jgi:hypothetical protein
MNKFELLSVILAGLSLLISLGAIYMAGYANNTNKNMFKRQGVIDLHMAWQGVNEIDKNKLIGPDIIKGVNALSLTASLWNHDVIEKSILYQTYWDSFKTLYEQIYAIEDLVPGQKRTCKSLLTNEISKAFEDMKNVDLKSVIQTKI